MEKLQSPPIITLVIPHHHGITVKGKTLEDFRQEYVVGKDDGAGRFKTTAPMQSFVVDMVQGASSKNSDDPAFSSNGPRFRRFYQYNLL